MIRPLFAQNSVYAKVRSLYAGRLRARDFENLTSCRSVGEAVDLLKEHTAYAGALSSLSGAEAAPLSVESALRADMLTRLQSIRRYQAAAGGHFYEYFIIRYDLAQLTDRIGSLNEPDDSYALRVPLYYNEHSGLDLYRLASAADRASLLAAVKCTPYETVTAAAYDRFERTGNPAMLDFEFDAFADDAFLRYNGRRGKPKKNELTALYLAEKDLRLISRFSRLLRFGVDDAVLQEMLRPRLTALTEKQIAALAEAKTEEGLIAVIRKTPYAAMLRAFPQVGIRSLATKHLATTCADIMRRSTDADTLLYAYMTLASFEVSNITHIIEGIRYGLPPEELLAAVILPEKAGEGFGH